MRSACVTCVYVPKRVIVRHTAKQQLASFIHVVLWGAHNVTHCKARCGTTTGIVFSCGAQPRRGAEQQLASFLGTKKRGTFRLPQFVSLVFQVIRVHQDCYIEVE